MSLVERVQSILNERQTEGSDGRFHVEGEDDTVLIWYTGPVGRGPQRLFEICSWFESAGLKVDQVGFPRRIGMPGGVSAGRRGTGGANIGSPEGAHLRVTAPG